VLPALTVMLPVFGWLWPMFDCRHPHAHRSTV
jgi:hypothetical protein